MKISLSKYVVERGNLRYLVIGLMVLALFSLFHSNDSDSSRRRSQTDWKRTGETRRHGEGESDVKTQSPLGL